MSLSSILRIDRSLGPRLMRASERALILGLWLVLAASAVPARAFPSSSALQTPQQLDLGIHLFLDDGYYAESDSTTTIINHPFKLPDNPVVQGEAGNPCQAAQQPFTTVIKEGETYRMWYNRYNNTAPVHWGDNLYYIETTDPRNWGCGQQIDVPHTVTASVTQGPQGYVLANTVVLRNGEYSIGDDYILTRVSTSNDGIHWSQITEYGNGSDTIFPGHGTRHDMNWGDILNIYWDEWDQQYVLFFRYYGPYTWTDGNGVVHTNTTIRRVGRTVSKDLVNWSQGEVLFSPDTRDTGVTQFYGGPAGVRHIGPALQIGFEKVLRDDIARVGAPEGAYGYGYTVLAWRRPGGDWQRMREPFLDASNEIGAWDYAHAWIDTQVDVSDTLTYFYYGGYKWGHKWDSLDTRQLGAALIGKNRYIARKDGVIVTRPLTFDADRLFLNVDARAERRSGQVTVSLLRANGTNLMTCTPITVDNARAPVECPQPLLQYAGQTVKFRFDLDQAYLFGFELASSTAPTPTPRPSPTPTPQPTATATPRPTKTSTPQATATSTPQATATPFPTLWEWEAEAGVITPPMQISSDSTACEGRYVSGNVTYYAFDPDRGGSINFEFGVPAGSYDLWLLGKGNGWRGNSLYIQVDDGPALRHEHVYFDWGWQKLELGPIAAGSHTLHVVGREAGMRLDRLILTADTGFEPGPSCAPVPTATPSETPSPFRTGTPTVSPTDTATPSPTVTPTLTATPTPTATPASTLTPLEVLQARIELLERRVATLEAATFGATPVPPS